MPAKAKKVTITMKSISDTAGGAPDVTGFAGSVTTVSCIGEELASMTRNGAANARLIIEKDRRHHCHYGTEYGEMLLGISASRIVNNMTEDGGDMYFKYTIDVNSALVSENEIYLNVKVSE